MNHNHKKCEHELAHCEDCDVVYCTKCNIEWIRQSLTYGSGATTIPSSPWVTYTTPYNGDPNITLCNCSHTIKE